MQEIEDMDVQLKGVSSIEDFLTLQALPIHARLDAHEPVYDQRKPTMSADERVYRFGGMLQSMARHKAGRANSQDLSVLFPTSAQRDAYQAAVQGASENVPADGGFLVGEDFAQELLKRTYATGILPAKCRRMQISNNANSLKLPGIDETSRADGSRHGGVRSYWPAEGGTITTTAPKYRMVNLNLNKLAAAYYATDELMQDASMLGAVVEDAFGEEMGFKLDDAIWNGDGVGKPKGVQNATGKVDYTAVGTVSALDASDLVKAFARVWARSMNIGEWFTNQDAIPNLHTMVLSVGASVVPMYQPMNFGGNFGVPNPFGQLLYGRPINFIEQAPQNGVDGSLTFADMSQYLLVDKGGLRRAVSIHVEFLTDQVVFRWTYRVDGQPLWHSALTPFKGTNTLSPFVRIVT